MKTVIYFLLVSTIIFITSCTKEIKFKGDNAKSLLVLNGIIENNSIIQVSISKSTPAIGEQNTGSAEITSLATLVLTDNTTSETFTSNQINSKGFYEFGTTAKAGHSYSISVTHPDYTPISSSMVTPENLTITSWDTTHTEEPGGYNGEILNVKQISIKWQDPIGTNKYAIKVFAIDTLFNYETIVSSRIYVDENDVNINGETTLFEDKSFNNTLKTLAFSFYSEYYKDANNLNLGEKSYRIVLYNLSTEVYSYITSTNKSGDSGNPFSEPVAIYSNVKNGIGIFGGMGTAVVNIK